MSGLKKYLFVDTETTGLDPKINDVHQIAGQIVIDGVTVEEFNYQFQPHSWDNVQEEALAVSGLTVDDLKKRTMTSKKTYTEFNTLLCRFVDKYNKKDKFVIGGYNCNFDAGFINEWYIKHGNKYFFGLCHGGAYLDGLLLALMYEIKCGKVVFEPNRKLGTVAKHLGIELDNAHDALADIRATRQVIKTLWNRTMGV
jgi:DNA polymerase-3 subunit epsilon